MRVLVRNGSHVEVILVNYACAEDSCLHVQDVLGDRYVVPGFESNDEVCDCLKKLFADGFYDFSTRGSVMYCEGGDC